MICLPSYTLLEGVYGLMLKDFLGRVAELSPPLNIVPSQLTRLLHTEKQILHTVWPLVRPLEVLDKDTLHISPAINAICRQAVEPSPRSTLQHQREVAHGHKLISSANLDSDEVVIQPSLSPRIAVIFLDPESDLKSIWEWSGADFST